jgi:hypothetical protein
MDDGIAGVCTASTGMLYGRRGALLSSPATAGAAAEVLCTDSRGIAPHGAVGRRGAGGNHGAGASLLLPPPPLPAGFAPPAGSDAQQQRTRSKSAHWLGSRDDAVMHALAALTASSSASTLGGVTSGGERTALDIMRSRSGNARHAGWGSGVAHPELEGAVVSLHSGNVHVGAAGSASAAHAVIAMQVLARDPLLHARGAVDAAVIHDV